MYLLDADVLIQAKNRHYGFDFCPAFWEWLQIQHALGQLASVEAVGDEVAVRADELSTWASQQEGFFLAADVAAIVQLQQLSRWATANYEAPGPTIFLAAADSYLVAHAAAHGHTVVTMEGKSNSPTKIKIPDACAAVGVPCIDVFELLRTESARFVL